jgi:hypothetical protein
MSLLFVKSVLRIKGKRGAPSLLGKDGVPSAPHGNDQ